MKRLTLMRHGDARWKDAKLSDLERPLNRRGVAAAEAMAQRLRALELVPDLVLVSPAQRTRQTAEIVARELAIPARRVVRTETLYLASAADMLKLVQASGPRVSHLLLVAHNPGLSELIQLLVPDDERAGLGTAAVCSISFEASAWSALDAGAVRAVRCENPPKGLFGLFG
jgi:phosphohistidine phosphatase